LPHALAAISRTSGYHPVLETQLIAKGKVLGDEGGWVERKKGRNVNNSRLYKNSQLPLTDE
jgi:hypothetical protein